MEIQLFIINYFTDEGGIIPTLLSYFLFLGHANSALNPVVYCFMTRNFRRSVAELICHGTSKFNHRKSYRNVS